VDAARGIAWPATGEVITGAAGASRSIARTTGAEASERRPPVNDACCVAVTDRSPAGSGSLRTQNQLPELSAAKLQLAPESARTVTVAPG
jgi:hypothetical protein